MADFLGRGNKAPFPHENESHGYKLQFQPSRLSCLISLAVFIGIIAIIGGITSAYLTPQQKGVQNSSSPATSSLATSSDAKDVPTKIGTAIDNGKVSVKVNAVKELSEIDDNYMTYKPDTGGKFIVINLIAKNTGKELYSFLVNNFHLKATDGKQYSPDTIFTVKDYLNSGSMNPGLSETGFIAFEVPKDVKLSTVNLEFQEFLSFNSAVFSLVS